MNDLYTQALSKYQQNNYEEALDLLRQCEQSMKVDALIRECNSALKTQYQYILDDSVHSGNMPILHEYIRKYRAQFGDDQYILDFVSRYESDGDVAAENEPKDKKPYIIGGIICAIVIAAIFAFVNANKSDNTVSNLPDNDTATDTMEVVNVDSESGATQQNVSTSSDEYTEYGDSDNGTTEFSGYINGKYEIHVTLTRNGDNLYGRYYYAKTMRNNGDKPSTYITLRGSIDNSGYANLTGTYYDSSESEQWHGNFETYDGEIASFSGQLQNSDGQTFNISFGKE